MAKQKQRCTSEERKTKETRISCTLDLDGSGNTEIKTPCGFMDHMITAMARHALFDLTIVAEGDLEVDAHHTVEDLGLTLGQAFLKAVGDKKGITRFGQALIPMDEALASCAVDVSGRPHFVYDVKIPERSQWEFDVNLVKEFFAALASTARITLHLRLLYGENYHHCCEALFKAAGRALRQAVSMDPREEGVPTSKGTLG
jgi:imidazoleglycerol-phosphate dehydratase